MILRSPAIAGPEMRRKGHRARHHLANRDCDHAARSIDELPELAVRLLGQTLRQQRRERAGLWHYARALLMNARIERIEPNAVRVIILIGDPQTRHSIFDRGSDAHEAQ